MPKTLFICHVLGLIVWCFLTFQELETLNSQSTQRLKTNLENMVIKKIWRVLNSELIKAILSKDPWLKGLIETIKIFHSLSDFSVQCCVLSAMHSIKTNDIVLAPILSCYFGTK